MAKIVSVSSVSTGLSVTESNNGATGYVPAVVLLNPTTGELYAASGGGGGGGGDASAANQVITNTRVGDVVETAPASDTASSGLNGRLQRIAQRLTSLIALWSAGPGTAAAALRVTLASDGPGTTLLTSLDTKAPALAVTRTTLLNAVTATGAGSAFSDSGRPPSFSANVTGTGAVTATVLVEARNTASGVWFTLATITLSGTTSAADGFASLSRYAEYRANVTARSGTGAAVTVTMGS